MTTAVTETKPIDQQNCSMFQTREATDCPSIPKGLRVLRFDGPKLADGWGTKGLCRVIHYGGETYWPLSYLDNRVALSVVVFDKANQVVRRIECPGARYLYKITGDRAQKTVTFWGQSDRTVVKTWDELGLRSYKASLEDVKFVAKEYGLTISNTDAQALVDALPTFGPENCCPDPNSQSRDAQTAGLLGMTVGALIGGVLGGAAGFAAGGPAGAVAGAGVGLSIGSSIGSTLLEEEPPEREYTFETQESATHIRRTWAVGPYANTHWMDDLTKFGNFPRFRQIDGAAAIAPPAADGTLRGYYPKSDKTQAVVSSIAPLNNVPGEPIYHFNWVVVKVADRDFQIRIVPEEYLLNPADRINHSQLSEGGRIAGLLGYPAMQVYGAGGMLVQGGVIRALNSQSGHYFRSFKSTEAEMIAEVKAGLTVLGYDTSGIVEPNEFLDAQFTSLAVTKAAVA